MLARASRSSVCTVKLIYILEVLHKYPLFPLCSHLIRGYEIIIKRYGLSVSPCMVALCIGIGCVLPKYSPTNVVVDCE